MPKGGKRQGSGRKRKPSELRVLEGSFRKDQHAHSPQIAGKFPEPPAHLLEAERNLWQTFPKPPWILESDLAAVEGAVAIYASLIACRKAEPRSIDGEVKLWGRLLTYLSALGLTPADRSKMTVPSNDENEETAWKALLG